MISGIGWKMQLLKRILGLVETPRSIDVTLFDEIDFPFKGFEMVVNGNDGGYFLFTTPENQELRIVERQKLGHHYWELEDQNMKGELEKILSECREKRLDKILKRLHNKKNGSVST